MRTICRYMFSTEPVMLPMFFRTILIVWFIVEGIDAFFVVMSR